MLQLKSVLSLLACSCFLAGTAVATADGPEYFRVTGVAGDDVLNIRAAPSASSTLIGTIPSDKDGIANLGCIGGLTLSEWEKATETERRDAAKNRWCRVGYDRSIGWVAGWFLAEGGNEDQFRAGGVLSEMAGSEWQLRDFTGEVTNGVAWISFRADNAVGGNAGCNNFNGTHNPVQDAPLFSKVATTRKMCPENLMETETRLLQVLSDSRGMVSYHLLMTLFDENGSVLATFTRRDPD